MASPRKKTAVPAPATATTAKGWKKASSVEPLELPSGNVAKVKRPGLDALLVNKVIPDSLSPIAQGAVNSAKGQAPKKTDVGEMLKDPEQVKDVFSSFDKVWMMCVTEPRTFPVNDEEGNPLDDSTKAALCNGQGVLWEDALWIDEVDFNDKMFVFQFVVGGVRDLEPFRQGLDTGLGGVHAGEDVEDSSV